MTDKMDELIDRVLDGKASKGEMREVADWVEDDELNLQYFYQRKKIWHLTNEPKLSFEDKAEARNLFLNYMHRITVKSHRARVMRWGTVAAVVVLGIGALWLYRGKGLPRKEVACLEMVKEEMPVARLILANGDTVRLTQEKEEMKKLSRMGICHDSLRGLSYTGVKVGYADSLNEEVSYNVLQVPEGVYCPLELSDGSRVWVNSATKLRYPRKFVGKERRVFLSGEAYFEVMHDEEHPFIVETEGVDVKVYGTRFNVNTYDKMKILTTLIEGRVGVHIVSTGQEVILKPKNMAEFREHDQAIRVREVDTEAVIAWKEGKIVFEEQPIEQIMERLSHWYGLKVFYKSEEVKHRTFTGMMTRTPRVADILRLIEQTGVVRFEQKGEVVTVE